MSAHQIKYELLKEDTNSRHRHTYIQVCLLVALCAMSSIAVFVTWTVIYRKHVNIPPPNINDIPDQWPKRAVYYAKHIQENSLNNSGEIFNLTAIFNKNNNHPIVSTAVKELDNERIYPSKLGQFIYQPVAAAAAAAQQKQNNNNLTGDTKFVCYFIAPKVSHALQSNPRAAAATELQPHQIPATLCTHINVGIAGVRDNRIYLPANVQAALSQVTELRRRNKQLKVLLWIGGADDGSDGFSQMVTVHANRKLFIQSMKSTLETYHIDGIDLDWEFPSTRLPRERQHFTQLLHEIRREYQRERRTYLLSVAVAALAGMAEFSYDVRELNEYADYVNVMTYDFHAYAKETPFTGLNSPLYHRPAEHNYLSVLNINASIHYWLSQGLDRKKLIVGLPTYGHSFKLVNPFNGKIMAPAEGFGDVGQYGFVSYSEACWFQRNNYFVQSTYDADACSPFMHANTEWISYEDERSVECKSQFIRMQQLGGAMLFALNTDDTLQYCDKGRTGGRQQHNNVQFPLAERIRSVLFGKELLHHN